MRKSIKNDIDRLLLPDVCVLCNDVLDTKERYVCSACRYKISYPMEPTCLRCGREIADVESEYCAICAKQPRSFVAGFPAMNYQSPMDESLAAFKYHNQRAFAAFYAQAIWKQHGDKLKSLGIEAIIPVPIHEKKRRKRGYNQAEVLAEALSAYLDVPVDNTLLVRTINTIPQKELNPFQREINLKNAFQSTEKIVNYKKVLLVDDIYTTGATVEACTQRLLEKNIEKIYYTSVCIGSGVG